MAAAVATKPGQVHQKMKRPPPPSLQMNSNGINSSQSSPSPSMAAKRPPSATKQPPSSTVGLSNGVNGAPARPTKRQKTGDGFARPNKAGATGTSNETLEQTRRRLAKKLGPQPYGEHPDGDRCVRMTWVMLTQHSPEKLRHFTEVQRRVAVPDRAPSSDALSVRPAGWQLLVYFRDAILPRARQEPDGPTRHAG